MWKVLIADDEPKIRRGLRAAVESRPEMTVVAEAEDGQTALALVHKERPDVLLIDVRMPFLSGLELIEKINAIHRDCVIIVVSGHDEFEYAKRALELRVFEYVLKPVPRDVLASVLERATAELEGSRRQSQYLAWAREQLERNMPYLREQFLREWVHGRLSRSEREEQMAFLGLTVREPLSMALIRVVERLLAPGPSGEKDRRLALYAVRTVAEQIFAEVSTPVVFQDEQDCIVVVASGAVASAWMEAASRVEGRISRALAHGLLMSTRQVPGGAEGVPETYEALAAEVRDRASLGSFVVRAQSYIEAHLREHDLSLEEVAAEIEISPGYLSRLLKQETGYSFVDYLTRARITTAMRLMNDPALKVYEVAEAVGYQSQHYFSRAFKKVLGRSPIEYRKGGEGANAQTP